jgi:hypothetical protein
MLHKETVEEGTLELIRKLSADKIFNDFRLAGGTALSLQIGHRKSIDIDMFINKTFNASRLGEHLQKKYNAEEIRIRESAIFSYINDIKIDMVTEEGNWLRPPLNIEGVRMASLHDIAAMKLIVINYDGQRLKDFIDIHFLLEHISLDEMRQAYGKKYPQQYEEDALDGLMQPERIDHTAKIDYIRPKPEWTDVVKRLDEAFKNPKRIYKEHQIDKSVTDERKQTQNRKRGRTL